MYVIQDFRDGPDDFPLASYCTPWSAGDDICYSPATRKWRYYFDTDSPGTLIFWNTHKRRFVSYPREEVFP